MLKQKDGFLGQRAVVLPPMVVEAERCDPLMSGLYLTDIGYYPHAAHHYRERRRAIGQYVLIYCADGSGWYRTGGHEYRVRRNQFFILPDKRPHAYGADPAEGWTIYWIHFQGDHAALFADGALEPKEIDVSMNSRISDRNNIFEEILTTLERGTDLESLRYACSLLHHYLASMRYLTQFRRALPRRQEDDAVSGAIHFMRESLEQRISLADVAAYVGYSPSHLSAMFRQRTGLSPLAYFNRLKVERARHLLEQTDMRVNQIAMKLGFEDSLYFSRLFSRLVGRSPRQFRKKG